MKVLLSIFVAALAATVTQALGAPDDTCNPQAVQGTDRGGAVLADCMGVETKADGVVLSPVFHQCFNPDTDAFLCEDEDYIVTYRSPEGATGTVFFWDTHTGKLRCALWTRLLLRALVRVPGAPVFVMLQGDDADSPCGGDAVATAVLNVESRQLRFVTESLAQPAAGRVNESCSAAEAVARLKQHGDQVRRMCQEAGWQGKALPWEKMKARSVAGEAIAKNGAAAQLPLFPAYTRGAVLRPISKAAGAFRVQNGERVTDGFSVDLLTLRGEAPYYGSPEEKLTTGMFLPPAAITADTKGVREYGEIVRDHTGNDPYPFTEHGTQAGWNICNSVFWCMDGAVMMSVRLLSPKGELYALTDFDPKTYTHEMGWTISDTLTPTCTGMNGQETEEWAAWGRSACGLYNDLVEKDGKLYYVESGVGCYADSTPVFRIVELMPDKTDHKIVCAQHVDRAAPYWDWKHGIVILPQNGGYTVYRVGAGMQLAKAADLHLHGRHYAIVLPDGHYAGSPGCEEILAFQSRGKAMDMTPLAPWRNRPDEVLTALGGDAAAADALRAATQRHFAEAGVDASTPEPRPEELPELQVAYPAVQTDNAAVKVDFACAAHAEAVKKIRVWANGAELAPVAADIAAGAKRTLSVEIPLAPGCNMLEIRAVDARGRQSPHERFRVVCAAKQDLLREGMDYAYGRNGKKQDYIMTRKLYEAAAANGNAEAMYRLARMHRYKLGDCQDPAQARSWYQKAAELGHAKAKTELNELRR